MLAFDFNSLFGCCNASRAEMSQQSGPATQNPLVQLSLPKRGIALSKDAPGGAKHHRRGSNSDVNPRGAADSPKADKTARRGSTSSDMDQSQRERLAAALGRRRSSTETKITMQGVNKSYAADFEERTKLARSTIDKAGRVERQASEMIQSLSESALRDRQDGMARIRGANNREMEKNLYGVMVAKSHHAGCECNTCKVLLSCFPASF
jgi:hypothetical protein